MLTGELFIREGLISDEQLQVALQRQVELGGAEPIAQILVMLGYIGERDRARCTGKIWGIPFVDVKEFEPTYEALETLDKEIANKLGALPLQIQEGKLLVAMSNPLDIFMIDELRSRTGYDIEPMIAVVADLEESLIQHYQLESRVNAQVSGEIDRFHQDLKDRGEVVIHEHHGVAVDALERFAVLPDTAREVGVHVVAMRIAGGGEHCVVGQRYLHRRLRRRPAEFEEQAHLRPEGPSLVE